MNLKTACPRIWALGGVLVLSSLCLCAGCSSTYPARRVTPSGFLGDYSQLKKGKDSLLLYVNPRTDLAAYRQIILDPVQMYTARTNSDLARLSKEDQQRLVNYMEAVLRKNLQEDHALVDKPGPGVMRVRVAITEAKGANVIMDTISTALPIGLAVSEVKMLATGTHSAVGSAGLECEGLDSVTQERLFAAVDARVGRKVTGKFDKFKKYRTAEDAFDYWAQWLRVQLRGAGSRPASP